MREHLGDDAELFPLGILDEDAALEVERHIATCVPCETRVMQAQLLAAQLASGLRAATPSSALGRRIAESLKAPGIAEAFPAPGTSESERAARTEESERAARTEESDRAARTEKFGRANERELTAANARLGSPVRSIAKRTADAANRSSFARRYGGLALAAGLALAVLALGWQTLAFRARIANDDLALATLVHSHFNHVAMTPESAHPVAAKVLYARDGSWLYIIADEPGGALHVKVRTGSGVFELGSLRNSGRVATLLERPPERIKTITLQRDGADVASATLVYGK